MGATEPHTLSLAKPDRRGSSRAGIERWLVRLVVAAAVALAVWGTYGDRVGGGADASATSAPAAVRLGALAPPFALPSARGNGELSLAAYAGRPVVINFWATWCPPCRLEMPEFERLQAERGTRVALLGVDLREDAETVRSFLRTYGITYPIGLDADGAVGAAFRVTGLPTTVFVDAAGVVRDRVVGPLTYDGLVQRAARVS